MLRILRQYSLLAGKSQDGFTLSFMITGGKSENWSNTSAPRTRKPGKETRRRAGRDLRTHMVIPLLLQWGNWGQEKVSNLTQDHISTKSLVSFYNTHRICVLLDQVDWMFLLKLSVELELQGCSQLHQGALELSSRHLSSLFFTPALPHQEVPGP